MQLAIADTVFFCLVSRKIKKIFIQLIPRLLRHISSSNFHTGTLLTFQLERRINAEAPVCSHSRDLAISFFLCIQRHHFYCA